MKLIHKYLKSLDKCINSYYNINEGNHSHIDDLQRLKNLSNLALAH